MKKIRLISRLDIKDHYVVKGIQFEGLRKIGNPNELAKKYYLDGIDEIIYIDSVASMYNRNNLQEIVYQATKDIFIPITVGGGIRTTADVKSILQKGADKVAINTAAIKEPQLITDVANLFGTQCMVLSIQAKKNGSTWEAYYDNGREHSGKNVLEWAKEGQERGAGEILITSVDCEGLQAGMDLELLQMLCDNIRVPIIASGGVGNTKDIYCAALKGASAIAVASILQYKKIEVHEIKKELGEYGIKVRA